MTCEKIVATVTSYFNKYVIFPSYLNKYVISEETIVHALVSCDFVQAIWFASNWSLRIFTFTFFSFAEFMVQVFEAISSEDVMDEFFAIAYTIWNARNILVYEDWRLHIMEILHNATKLMEVPGAINETGGQPTLHVWKKPSDDNI